jgi:hypothetical protein
VVINPWQKKSFCFHGLCYMNLGWTRSLRAWAICCEESFGFLPSFTPRRFAASLPALVRSCIRERSSSASTPTICHMARPVGVWVSMDSVRDLNLILCPFRSDSVAKFTNYTTYWNEGTWKTLLIVNNKMLLVTLRQNPFCCISPAPKKITRCTVISVTFCDWPSLSWSCRVCNEPST